MIHIHQNTCGSSEFCNTNVLKSNAVKVRNYIYDHCVKFSYITSPIFCISDLVNCIVASEFWQELI